MGDLIIKVMNDILSFAMVEPFNYIVALVLMVGIATVIKSIRRIF